MRLLHTSDWHLGRQLHGASLIEDQRHVLEQIVAAVRDQAVDAIIIAGDVYDRAVPPAEAVTLLGQTLALLCRDLGKQVVVISGNHDSAERLGFAADLMGTSGLHIVSQVSAAPQPVTLKCGDSVVDVFGLPYAGPLGVRDALKVEVSDHEQAMRVLLECVDRQRVPGRATIVAGHCFVDGGAESDSERPLSIGGADRIPASLFASYDYVALGHLHGPQRVREPHVRYSGSILKYSFSEVAHNKSVTLVDIGGPGSAEVQMLPLIPRREVRIIEGSLETLLEDGRSDSHTDDYVLARLTDRQALLDVMGKLRDVYPNVLQMQYVGLRDAQLPLGASQEQLGKSHLALFEEFFEAIESEPLTEPQRACLEAVLDGLHMDDQS